MNRITGPADPWLTAALPARAPLRRAPVAAPPEADPLPARYDQHARGQVAKPPAERPLEGEWLKPAPPSVRAPSPRLTAVIEAAALDSNRPASPPGARFYLAVQEAGAARAARPGLFLDFYA